jgi:hypothetical protein
MMVLNVIDNFCFLIERFRSLPGSSSFLFDRFYLLNDFFALYDVINGTREGQNGSGDTLIALVRRQTEWCLVKNNLADLQIEFDRLHYDSC